jgi:predicted TPR repeat methyltransferase
MPFETKRAGDPSRLLKQATDLHRKGNLSAAEGLYLEILEARPDQFEVLHLLGILRYQVGRFTEALASYDKALRIKPRSADTLSNRGSTLRVLNRPAEALASYDKALAINPNAPYVLNNRGNALRDLNRTAEALASFEKALTIKPDCVEALDHRGNALRDLKRPAEALASYDKALALKPDYAEALNNRGNALRDLNRTAEALASFDKALALKPDYFEALYNRGNALRDLNQPAEALASFDRAVAIDPRHAGAQYNRGNVLQDLQRLAEALASYDQALATDPDLAAAWLARGGVLQGMKRPQEAITAYRQALAKGGDADIIQYTLASLGAEIAPGTAPKKFVTELFDQCADRFDEHLVGKLKYRAPDFLFDLVARFVASRNLDILDLGCGTGLAGAQLHPLARTLTGVDLSSNMLKIARQRQIYDSLICSELVEFLQGQTKSFDLAVATDVFVYIGDLSSVFHGVRGVLRDGGVFGFSAEASEEQDFVLRATCRYAHSDAYLRKLAEDHGFVLEAIESKVIRQQDGSDVAGYMAILRGS